MAEKKEDMAGVTEHYNSVDGDMHKDEHVKEANVASVALAAALEAQKPKLWSRSMLQLYAIM